MVRGDVKSEKDEPGKKQDADAVTVDSAGDKENVDDSAFEVGTVHSVRKGDGSWHSAEIIHRRVNEGGIGDVEYYVHYEGFNRRWVLLLSIEVSICSTRFRTSGHENSTLAQIFSR